MSKKKNYKHLFFDLDNTLWDFRTNATHAIMNTVNYFDFESRKGYDQDAFLKAFWQFNNYLWQQFDDGNVNKEVIRKYRFKLIWQKLGWDDYELSLDFSSRYLDVCPTGTAVMPGVQDLLEELQQDYQLHIITNGFEKAQRKKMDSAGLLHYFDVIVSSDTIGKRKPDTAVFKHAMQLANAEAEQSCMIGDSVSSDVIPALALNMGAVFYNPQKIPHKANPSLDARHHGEILAWLNG